MQDDLTTCVCRYLLVTCRLQQQIVNPLCDVLLSLVQIVELILCGQSCVAVDVGLPL